MAYTVQGTTGKCHGYRIKDLKQARLNLAVE